MSELMSTPKQKGELYLASSLCDGLEDNDLRQVATLLRSKEADPNVLMPLHGITPFHLVIGNDSEAFAEEVTKLFLRHGGNPNVKSVDGMTPVHVAAAWGRTKILELLLANGGDPLCDDNDYCTPFNYAFQGEHYEAVAVLSKFCIDNKEDDETPKFKRELDKVIINNGDVLAEYILSDESSISIKDSSLFNNSQNKKTYSNGYEPDCGSTESILNKPIYEKIKLKRRVAQNADQIYCKDRKDSFDFARETEEEEMNLINEIISKLSSSVASNVDESFQNCENESLTKCRTSSPKRMQMTMTFHRSEKCKSAKEKLNTTLKVIKQHTQIPCFKNNNILASNLQKPCSISEINLLSKRLNQSLKNNVTQNKLKQQTPKNAFKNKWLDETIISKSPNLIIDTHREHKRRKSSQNLTPEKRESTKTSSKLHDNTPSHVTVRKYDKLNNYKTPVSRIPRLQKCLTTSGSSKTIKRSLETPKTVIPNIRKINCSKKNEEISCLNQTFTKADSSTSSLSADEKKLIGEKTKHQNFKNIAINLNDCTYERDLIEKKKSNELIDLNTDQTCDKKITEKNEKFVNSSSKFNVSCNMISGIGILDSEASSKSDSKLANFSNETEKDLFSDRASVDLNQAITDYFSSAESKKDQYCDITEHSQKSNDCSSITSCIVCEKEPSEASTSFLSLAEFDDIHKDGNFENNDDVGCKISISPSSNLVFSGDDSSCKKLGSELFLSMEEEYKYEDFEEKVVFVERRLCVAPSCASSEINTSYYSCSTSKSEALPRELYLMDNVTLRERLKTFGETPGPITKTTHHLYLKRLHKLQTQKKKLIQPKISTDTQPNISYNLDMEKELLKSSVLSIEWVKNLDDFESTEQKIFQEFATPDPSRKWREGTSKCSFNYLLLDPRITKDLPRRAANLSLTEKWQTFLSAIFYVGKGKKSRPYAHLYDAFKIWVSKDGQNVNSDKIQRILDIWNEGRGVIVLHVFHNTIPVEAYTREAAMIEALGTRKLGNCKGGDYYGVVSTWKSREKCDLGRYFLFKALQILLLEGERQIFPDNL